MNNYEKFIEEYSKHLKVSMDEYPYVYIFNFDDTLTRASRAIKNGTMDKESTAIKRTCKALGLKHTYKAIKAFISPKL